MNGSSQPLCSVGVIAKLLMLTERRVQQLAAEGSIPKAQHGAYELAPTVRSYIRYLRDRSAGADVSGGDVSVYKTRMIKAKARIAEAEADQVDGALLRRTDVEAAWSKMIGNMRARLLSIPTKTAPLVHSSPNIASVSFVLTTALYEALEEISRAPAYAVPRLGDADAGTFVGGESAEGGGPATEVDGLTVV
jgi:hypothetical protein